MLNSKSEYRNPYLLHSKYSLEKKVRNTGFDIRIYKSECINTQHLRSNRGSILIVVLWSLFFLASLALTINTIITPQLNLAARLRDRVLLRQVVEAGVKRSIIEIRADETDGYDVLSDPWGVNEKAFKEIPLEKEKYFSVKYSVAGDEGRESETYYGLIDEERKININSATEEVLSTFFELVAETSSRETADIVASIIDWRDEDDETSDNGAESSYYQGLDPGYDSKNGYFDLLEELLLVKGITQEIYDKVEDYLTVYGDGNVNLNTADILVLQSLGMRTSLAEKVITFRKGDDGIIGTEDDNAFNSMEDAGTILSSKVGLFAEESNEFNEIAEGENVGVRSNNFRGISIGSLQDLGLTAKIIFVINRDEQIRYWREQ